MSIELKRIDDYRIKMYPTDAMKTDAFIYASEDIKLEPDALSQLQNAASVDEEARVFATPDIHKGYGVPIGCVFASPNLISPSAVGYDINCGMRLISTGFPFENIDIKELARAISFSIPLGEGKKNISLDDKHFVRLLKKGVPGLEELPTWGDIGRIFDPDDWLKDLPKIEEQGSIKGGDLSDALDEAVARGKAQLGTLGGGNHFIELQKVDEIYDPGLASSWGISPGEFVIMVHSGSRGFGHEIAGHFMRSSLKYCEKNRLFLPDRQFSYFDAASGEGEEYFKAMILASNFAFLNREIMTMLIRKVFRKIHPSAKLDLVYDISHNIVKEEVHYGNKYYVHRKGATRAFNGDRMKDTPFSGTGQPVLIPGSMGTSSYLLSGTDSGKESFFSVNHGAGRVMGRRAAAGKTTRKGKVIREGNISDEEFREEMKEVFLICEDRRAAKEEAPSAYKDIDDVIETVAGAGLAKKVARFKPLAVLKG